MKTTTYALLLAVLVALPATVLAQEPATAALDRENAQHFAIKLDPASQRIEPAGAVKFAIHVRAMPNVTIKLAVDGIRGQGYGAEIVDRTLVVKARDNASDYATIRIVGTSESGETHDAVAKVGLIKKPNATPATYRLVAEPAVQRITPGGEASFTIRADSREQQTLKLALAALEQQGYRAALSENAMKAPGEVTLTVKAGPHAARSAAFEVIAGSESGERHAVKMKVEMVKPAPDVKPNIGKAVKLVVYFEGEEPATIDLGELPPGRGRAWLLAELRQTALSLRNA